MTPNEYQKAALRTESIPQQMGGCLLAPNQISAMRLLHAKLGIDDESGELAKAIKASLFYNQELDSINIMEECGDLLWYIALALDVVGVSLERVMIDNIKKLRKRYPEKFTNELAKERLDKKV